jgi:hypothetical protein
MSKLTVTASLLLLVVAQSIVAKPVRVGPSHQTMKVVSMVENGPVVTLRFDNGSTADVAKSTLRIRDEAHKRGTARSIAELSRTSNLPAIARVAYMPDGTVKKVRLRVFANEAAMNAFTTQRASKEQHR